MKKNLIYLTILLVAIIFGCQREEINQSNDLNSIKNFLKLNGKEYDVLKISLENDFSQRDVKTTKIITKEDMLNQDVTKMSTNNITTLNLLSIVEKNEAIIAKYPVLKDFTSMLSIYNQALLIKDKTKLKAFAEKYNSFLIYFEEFNYVMLKVPVYKAALLNPNGIIKVDNQIRKYDENCLKIIKDGDVNKIIQLNKISYSTKEVLVFNFNIKKNIMSTNSKTLYNPNSNLYAVTLVHYVDMEYLNNEALGEYKFIYSAGANAATFFNNQPCGVTIFNLQSTSLYETYGYPGVATLPNTFTSPKTNQRNILYSQTNFTRNFLITDVFYSQELIFYRDFPRFRTTTDFGVMYPNNVIFIDNWTNNL